MKKSRYKVAWFKIDFKRSLDDELMILDIGGGQSSSMNGFDKAKVNASFYNTLTRYVKKVYFSTVFQNTYYQRLIVNDLVKLTSSPSVVFKTPNEMSAMISAGEITQDDVILFSDELKTPEIYSAYYQDTYGVPVVSGDSMFHILYRDKSLLYYLQTLFYAQPSYWHYPVKMSDMDLAKIMKELPESESGYYLKPTNMDVAKGIQVFATKSEMVSVLQERHEKNKTNKAAVQMKKEFLKIGHLAPQQERLEAIKKINAMRLFSTKKQPVSGEKFPSDDSIDHYDIQPKILGKPCEHQGQQWDPTGRAFITLIYDTEMNTLTPVVNGCSWILPKDPLSRAATATSSSLANLTNSSQFIEASQDECEWLQQAVQVSYGDVFMACFTQSAQALLDKLKTVNPAVASYCHDQIYSNPRYYVGREAATHLTRKLSDHAEERIPSYLGIAQALAEEEKFEVALESANVAKLLQTYLQDTPVANSWGVTITTVIASIYFKMGQLPKALSLYKEALTSKPESAILLDRIDDLERLISASERANGSALEIFSQ